MVASTEIDVRLFGMVVALAVIWIGFHLLSGGDFLTARNLWNLSVQSASIAIMATGMVLIIVSRNIDLSVGSLLGFLGYTMAMVQTEWIPNTLGLGFDRWYTWILALLVGLAFGAAIGGVQGFIVSYIGVPSFIVTLGGFLVWRGLIFRYQQGQTLAPLDKTFQLLGGGTRGSLGEWKSWLLGGLACAGIAYSIVAARRRRQRYRFALRPLGVDIGLGVLGGLFVLAAVWVANSYPWPPQLAKAYAAAHGIVEPAGGLKIPTGVAYPVVIMIGVALLMTYLARRRRFGRYVFAIGGNPEAAKLSGINVRRTIMFTFVLMGVLCAVQRGGPDGPPQRRRDEPRRAERARCDLGRGDRWHLVLRWRRHDPWRGHRRGGHAVAALGHGAAQGRRAGPGHRGRHRAGGRGRSGLGAA